MYQAMTPGIDIYGIEVKPVKSIRELPQELAERLALPEDALLGTAKLTVTGGKRLLVENHRGVMDYGRERIVVSLGRGKLNISGAELVIAAMNRRELLISGRIQSVEWE